MKPIEEVIDVVGDFGPGPIKQDESARFPVDENFAVAFDANSLQSDQMQLQMQEQAMMMPPQPG